EAATQAAKDATKSVPIVFTLVGDPLGAGIVDKLAQPGANVTGVSSLQTELMAKRLEVLKTLAPAVRRVWLIYYSVDLGTAPMIGKALGAAQRMKLDLLPRGVLDAMSSRGEADLAVRASSGELRSARLRVPDAEQRRRLTEPAELFRGL